MNFIGHNTGKLNNNNNILFTPATHCIWDTLDSHLLNTADTFKLCLYSAGQHVKRPGLGPDDACTEPDTS